jgi:RNA polymerase sigma factor (sigma-70 family)
MEVRHNTLRDLVSKYNNEIDANIKKEIFQKILFKVDRLLIYTIIKYKGQKEFELVDDQDLYNTSIIGLYKAIDGVKDDYPGTKLVVRIMSYVKEGIRLTYLGRRIDMKRVDFQTIERNLISPNNGIADAENKEIIEKVYKIFDSGIICRHDLNMLINHIINGLSYSEIARRLGLHYTTVSKRIKNVLRILRENI